ncbi:TSFM [Bugula neritina]|uniref:Elongation factor Ts, mitochondrial n=1 Tax=Bugula neritina TaxID=10212 RepID=A0A7J7KPE1_BUGNE|nr:TSFM [Bugula neritina]
MKLAKLNCLLSGLISSSIRVPSSSCLGSTIAGTRSCQTKAAPSVDKNSLSKLRKQTGYAFSNCRKALLMHDNDFDKALEWLKAEAAKEGWAKAGKLQNRPMSQGVVGVMTTPNSALMLEVNCETDFVARNTKFLELVSNISHICFTSLQTSQSSKVPLSTPELSSVTSVTNETIADIVAKEVGSIGENLRATRAIYMSVDSPHSRLANYIHTAGLNQNCLEIEGCKFGKYAGLVLLNGDVNQEDSHIHCLQIAQHVVGMNPKTIGAVEEETSETLESSSLSPEDTATHSADTKQSDGESRLLFQEFLIDPDLTKQWLEERNLSVADYVRFAVGEEASS